MTAASASSSSSSATMHAAIIRQYGSADVIGWEEVPMPTPGVGQVLVKIAAAGVNFIDTYMRQGIPPYNKAGLPMILGREAAGEITELGEGVDGFSVGDRVAFTGGVGTYAEYCVVPVSSLVTVPANIDLKDAAAVLLQGMTAHYLVRSLWELKPGQTCLIHAASGGVGRLLVQYAKHIGATSIGTVSSAAKQAEAERNGCSHVLNYTQPGWEEEVRKLTNGRGVDVVYDGVGKDTFLAGLKCLRPRGMMALFGASSGPVEPVDPQQLSVNGSLFMTRPTLWHYTATREELDWRANEVFAGIQEGWLNLLVCESVPLNEAGRAHAMLEGRQTMGKVLLVPPQ